MALWMLLKIEGQIWKTYFHQSHIFIPSNQSKPVNQFAMKDYAFSTYLKFSEKLTFYPLIRTRKCAYQGVRSNSFSENFAYVPNEWFVKRNEFVSVCWDHLLLKGLSNFIVRGVWVKSWLEIFFINDFIYGIEQ